MSDKPKDDDRSADKAAVTLPGTVEKSPWLPFLRRV